MIPACQTLPALLSLVLVAQAPPPQVAPTGLLEGRVLALPDSAPVADASVWIDGRRPPAVTDGAGRFTLTVTVGAHRLRVEAFGFSPMEMKDVTVAEGAVTHLTVLLEPKPFELAEIVVSPSAFGILREGQGSVRTLTREEVEASPHMGSDLFRAMERIPGISTHDVSAKLHVRGAPDDQVLTLLDGLELYEPYHMKYWDGSLSVMDPDAVGSVELLTGGFSAEYGDRLAGVMSMRSLDPDPEPRTELGLSAMNATVLSSGGFGEDARGSWLFLARRGFLKYVFAVTGVGEGQTLEPDYWDVFAKTRYQVAPGHALTAHVLGTGERVHAVEEDDTRVDGEYGSNYGWITWDAALAPALSVETILSAGSVTGDRRGEDDEGGDQRLTLRDQRNLLFRGLSQRWSYQPGESILLRWGAQISAGEAEYSYYRRSTRGLPNFSLYTGSPWSLALDRLAVTPSPSGTEAAAYVSGRARLTGRLTGEFGVRYDDVSYTGDRNVSPRLGLSFEARQDLTLRGAWGHYYQSQGLHELAAGDGDTTFHRAARAEHRILGVEHRRPGGVTLRVEAYQRRVRDPRPEYRTLVPEVEGLWEESLSDRALIAPTRGRARGLEVMGTGRVGNQGRWAASYALASSEDEVDGSWVPRPMDQRHTLNVEAAVQPRPGLTLSAAWTFHSGWPYTAQLFELVPVMNSGGAMEFRQGFGPLNAERMAVYHRLDFRVARRFPLRRGALSVFLDVFNAYNRENPYSVITHAFWRPDWGRPELLDSIEPQLGVLPTLGLRWEF